MLRHLGFLDVRVLDGGIAAWSVAGQATESGPSAPRAGDFSPSGPGLGRLLDAEDAKAYAAHGLLLDARPAARFRGENETIDAVAGHIPGAVSAPALDNVDPSGRFLPAEQLARRFTELGLAVTIELSDAIGESAPIGQPHLLTSAAARKADARQVGTYCGSGVQATHLALALSVAGITDDADVYIGSWSDWITDPGRPIALG
jgi:thiosulfate/3-mercaptopyruvate sulfurtransferase